MRERRNKKSGKNGGKQPYQCKNCKRKFITEKNYSEEFTQKAIAIFYEGNRGRAVGRITEINKSIVYNWTKKLGSVNINAQNTYSILTHRRRCKNN